jgi:hypothetical protein
MFCKNCIHYNRCNAFINALNQTFGFSYTLTLCEEYKDKTKFIELPCKIGDKCWKFRPKIDDLGYYTGSFKIVEKIVSGLSIKVKRGRILYFVHCENDNSEICDIVDANGNRAFITNEKGIKRVYFDYEEAEAKLNELTK